MDCFKRFWRCVFVTLCLAVPGQGAEEKPLRLAIPRFQTVSGQRSTDPRLQQLLDLVTARLTSMPGLELVERAELERILNEQALVLGQSSRPADAIRAGKLLRADWLLLGAVLKYEGTNCILL